MPILPAESDCFPEDLWTRETRLNGDGRWWCLHAKPRQEKSVARDLHQRSIVHYLPQAFKDGRTPAGRKTRSRIPLFPGYLFLYGNDHDRIEALRGNRLVQVLPVADQERLYVDLKQISRVLASGLPIVHEPTFPVGSIVRIMDGPLTGIIGRVVRRGKRDQFTAMVRFLGQGATIDLEDWQVQPVIEYRDDD